eukprot:maker-scaffold_5-snap-gene-5.52-mRNA-1 protein AED:0.11 eAED:0.11 QI:21/1/0.75/1/0.66/0.5/4/0/174
MTENRNDVKSSWGIPVPVDNQFYTRSIKSKFTITWLNEKKGEIRDEEQYRMYRENTFRDSFGNFVHHYIRTKDIEELEFIQVPLNQNQKHFYSFLRKTVNVNSIKFRCCTIAHKFLDQLEDFQEVSKLKRIWYFFFFFLIGRFVDCEFQQDDELKTSKVFERLIPKFTSLVDFK